MTVALEHGRALVAHELRVGASERRLIDLDLLVLSIEQLNRRLLIDLPRYLQLDLVDVGFELNWLDAIRV